MNFSVKSLASIAVASAFLFGSQACQKAEEIQPFSSPDQSAARLESIGDLSAGGFDVETFANKIEARLVGKVPGFGYRIIVNGVPYTKRPGGGGKARFALDAPERAYDATAKQEIGSCSKFITALLVTQVLEKNGKTLEEKVWTYCPTYFKPSADFKKLTFRDLLAHTSGVLNYSINSNGELADLQDSMEKGIWEPGENLASFAANDGSNTAPYGSYDYANINYGLCRMLVPYVYANFESPVTMTTFKSKENDYQALQTAISETFRRLMRERVFLPAGLEGWYLVDLVPWGGPASSFTKYYPTPNPGQPGADDTGSVLTCGAGGLNLSPNELAMVVAAARAGKIVKPSLLAQFKTGDGKGNQMGFDDAVTGKYGKYYWKNGSDGKSNAILFDFDGPTANVQLALTTNMGGTEVTNAGVWAGLFDQSWK